MKKAGQDLCRQCCNNLALSAVGIKGIPVVAAIRSENGKVGQTSMKFINFISDIEVAWIIFDECAKN